MKQSTTTYTKRVNARRAGVAAGIPSERVAITVHKNGDEVRFGWKESAAPVKKVTTSSKPPKVEQEERNGVKRPPSFQALKPVHEGGLESVRGMGVDLAGTAQLAVVLWDESGMLDPTTDPLRGAIK